MAQAYGTSMYNSARIKAIGNYAEAKDRFDTVVPIRGRTEDIRPIGEKRRYTGYTINKNLISVLDDNEPLGRYEHTYSANISNYKTIEFFNNGDIGLYSSYWKGPTLFGFLTHTLAKDIGTIKSCSGKWYFVNTLNEGFVFEHGMRLSKSNVDGNDVYRLKDAKPEKKYMLNRKVMNAIRKRYSYFTDYGKTCLSMNPRLDKIKEPTSVRGVPDAFTKRLDFDRAELLPYRYSNHDTEASILGRIGLLNGLAYYEKTQDLALLYELMMYVATTGGRYSWSDSQIICDPHNFLGLFEEVLKYEYKDSLYTPIEQPIGSIFNDKNKKYFNV
jgi:hypothetical protein